MRRFDNLEIGLADLVSMFGFRAHLVDYYEAVDDKYGISVVDGHYSSIPLEGWTAVQFE
jgi:hypothetical protein